MSDISYYRERLAGGEDSVSAESANSYMTSSEESFEDLAPYPTLGHVNADDDLESDHASFRAPTGEDASE